MDEAANGGRYVSGRSKVNEAIAADLARHVAGSEVPTGGGHYGREPTTLRGLGKPSSWGRRGPRRGEDRAGSLRMRGQTRVFPASCVLCLTPLHPAALHPWNVEACFPEELNDGASAFGTLARNGQPDLDVCPRFDPALTISPLSSSSQLPRGRGEEDPSLNKLE